MPIKKQANSSVTKTVKPSSTQSQSKKTSTGLRTSSSKDDYAQDYLSNIEDIRYGLVFLKDGSVVKILEILPINFDEKSDAEKDHIVDTFGFYFKSFPKTSQIKIMETKPDITNFTERLLATARNEPNIEIKKRILDYIKHVKRLQGKSLRKRYFFIFSYEGDSSEKSIYLDDILESMHLMTNTIVNAFRSSGNIVLNADYENETIGEILYTFFNPGSYLTEGFERRKSSLGNAKDFLDSHGKVRHFTSADYLAPRGIRFGKFDYLVVDGVYETFLALRDNSYPQYAVPGWLVRHLLDPFEGIDMDIKIRQLSHDTTMAIAERLSVINRGIAREKEGDRNKQEELYGNAENAQYIYDRMKEDEEMYEVNLTVTLKASSLKELMNKRKVFISNTKYQSYYFDECFMAAQDYYENSMPLNIYVPSVFNQNKRNFLNSSLGTLYCFSTYEMFETEGLCLGTTNLGTLFSPNFFNSKLFVNPHVFIAGTSGAGKSFTESMIASRIRMLGYRTIFILPLKGHEYKDMINSLNGVYIPFYPGSKVCINIMEIRPNGKTNFKDYEDMDEAQEMQSSLLAKKITSIVTFISLLARKELNSDISSELNAAIQRVYYKFGITDDNESIFDENGNIKPMPIISDLADEIRDNQLLAPIYSTLKVCTEGNCRNLNGQTNIDLENKAVAFDVNEDYVGEELLPVFMFLAYDMADAVAKRDISEHKAIIMDEVWKMLIIRSCAKQIFKMIKILRAYNCIVMTATQDIEDCANNEFGRSIITLSATKILLKAEDKEVVKLRESISLSDQNALDLPNMGIGQGIMCFNKERLYVRFDSSLLEQYLYTPDKKKKDNILRQMEALESRE